MTEKKGEHEGGLEKLLVALAIAIFVALSVVALHFSERLASGRERQALLALSRMKTAILLTREDDPAYSRIFRLEQKGKVRFGAVTRISYRGNSSTLALVFSPQGELEAGHFLGADISHSAFTRDGFTARLLGQGSGSGPAMPYPHAVSGATESYRTALAAVSRISDRIQSATKGKP